MPKIYDKNLKQVEFVHFSFPCPPHLYDFLKREAKKKGISIAALFRQWIDEDMKKHEYLTLTPE